MSGLTAIGSSTQLSMVSHRCQDLIALEELMAGLAHELNNPLSVIAGQALLLQETAGDARTAERAGKIGQAADRSARIIKSILAMARQDSVETWDVDLNEVIHDALESRGHALLASDIEVSLCLAESLPPVRGHGGQLGQVITNLLVNAQQAMDEICVPGQLKVISTFFRQERQIVVKVKDNGLGIPAAIRSRIFEPFVTSKEIGAGTGIGLALCKRIVEAHAGSITLERGQDEGATFVMRIPVKPASEHELRSPRSDKSARNCQLNGWSGSHRKLPSTCLPTSRGNRRL